MELIDQHTEAAVESREFLTVDDGILSKVLVRDTLGIEEAALFARIVEMAKAKLERYAAPE